MKKNLWQRIRDLWRAELFSPRDFVRRAAVIAAAFAAAQLLGLREFTSVLNGTAGSLEMGWQTAALLGVAYVLLYLALILVVPTLLIAAILLSALRKTAGKASHEP